MTTQLTKLPLSAGLCLALANTPGFAQPVGTSAGVARSLGSDLLERKRADRPLPASAEEGKQPAFQLPALSAPPAENQPLSAQLRVFSRAIRLEGNRVFSAQELAGITDRYTGRYVSTQELQQLRHELTRHYVDRGYINSGAVIPDQTVQDSIIRVLIIEGQMEGIEISGTEHLRDSYVRRRLQANADSPLQLDRLQESLQLLLESPIIERVNAELRPGSRPGLAVLKTQVQERTPYQLGLVFDNQIAPSVGEYEGTVFAAHNNLTGNGDVISAQGRFAEGLTGYGADYWLPVNRYDTSLHAWYTHYDTHIIEEPFNEIDVTSASESYGISLSHPFYRKPGNTVSGSITLERRRSNTALLGEPFSFSPGVQEGKTSLTVIRIGQEWIGRSTDQVFALRSSFNIGIDAIDATINANGPDGRFFSWLGQFQWARRIGPAQLIWRGDVQAADAPLLPLEKFQVGGVNSVRGYRENQLVRDWGFSSTLEYRHPLFNDWLGADRFFVAPFVDVGGAWNLDDKTLHRQDVLASVGLGLIYDPDRRLHTHLYWGKALVDVHNPNHSVQDYGIHFKISGQFF